MTALKNKVKNRFKNWKRPSIPEGRPTKYGWMVRHRDKLKLGENSDIGAFTYINAQNGVVINKGVQIGSHCSIYSISTIDDKKGKVVLGDNCKIGSHSVIMPGVTIGKNSVVGAFSFVNRDIPADKMAFGVPVNIIRKIR